MLLHYFLHAEPSGVAAWQLAKMNLAKMTHRRRVAGKKMAFEVKTTLERSRPVGSFSGGLAGSGLARRVPFLPADGGVAPATAGGGRPACRREGSNQVAEKTTQTIYIDADPGTVMEVIADIDSYPDWVSEYKEAEVQEADADGYPKVARMVLDAAVLKDTLVMSYKWPADRQSVSWTLVSSSLLQGPRRRISLGAQGIWNRRHL